MNHFPVLRSTFEPLTPQNVNNDDDNNNNSSSLDAASLIKLFQSKQERIMQQEFHKNLSGMEEIQMRLVQLGREMGSTTTHEDDSIWAVSRPTRVIGCTSNVLIQVILHRKSDIVGVANEQNVWVTLRGSCDALVSRGILNLWIKICQGESAEIILQHVNPTTVADQWGLRSFLSKGRNDGLASMVRTTQTLIQELLNDKRIEGEEQETLNQKFFIAEKRQLENEKTTLPVVSTTSRAVDRGHRRATVALLLSGGVDSSVALHLLLQQGYDVTCFYLKIWLEDEMAHLGECPWENDIETCQQVCWHAGNVPLEILSLQQEYHEKVVSCTISEARQGRTPNPDIMCNSRIKFGCFYDALTQLNDTRHFDYVATGHYAQLVRGTDDRTFANGDWSLAGGMVRLFRAPDPIKDQTYFLCALTQQQLQRVLFPIGHLQKAQVRQLAQDFQLPNMNRPDSQGLCFLGKLKFSDFLRAYLGEAPGDIVDAVTGQVLGRHRGLWFHTVGQRKGIGPFLNAMATAHGPWYVVAKDPSRNIVYCSNQYDNEELFQAPRSEFTVENISWIAGSAPLALSTSLPSKSQGEGRLYRVDFKIRHGPRLAQGFLQLFGDDDGLTGEGLVRLDAKDGGLAPGQFVVFYNPQNSECLGGGVISERHWTQFILHQQQKLLQSSSSLLTTTTMPVPSGLLQKQLNSTMATSVVL